MDGLYSRIKARIVALMGSDIDAVRKVDATLEQPIREISHKIRNNEARLHSLTRLVRSMRADGACNEKDRNSIHRSGA